MTGHDSFAINFMPPEKNRITNKILFCSTVLESFASSCESDNQVHLTFNKIS